MSLYVNHQPLRKIIMPNYCRLFKYCDQPKHFDVFEVFSPRGEHPQMSLLQSNEEVMNTTSFKHTYKDFVQDLMQYLYTLK